MPQRTNTRWKEIKKLSISVEIMISYFHVSLLLLVYSTEYIFHSTRVLFYFLHHFLLSYFFPSSVCINIHPRMLLVHLIIREIWREIKKKKRLYTFHNTSSGITFAKSPSQYAMYADIIKYWSKVNVSWAKGT